MEAVLIKYSNKLKAFSLLRYQRDGEKFGWVKLSAFGAYFLKAKSVESLNYAYITIARFLTDLIETVGPNKV